MSENTYGSGSDENNMCESSAIFTRIVETVVCEERRLIG